VRQPTSFDLRKERFLCGLERFDGHFTGNRRELLPELIEGIAGFEVVERVISKAWGSGSSVAQFPFNTCRRASTFCGGQGLRLARVRLRTRPPSRKNSRSSTAGEEFRLEMTGTYMHT